MLLPTALDIRGLIENMQMMRTDLQITGVEDINNGFSTLF